MSPSHRFRAPHYVLRGIVVVNFFILLAIGLPPFARPAYLFLRTVHLDDAVVLWLVGSTVLLPVALFVLGVVVRLQKAQKDVRALLIDTAFVVTWLAIAIIIAVRSAPVF
jgi:hypothetical protein